MSHGTTAPDLVERDCELATLESTVRLLASGRSSSLEICGQRGTGRTALLDHAITLAKRSGATVLTAAGGSEALAGHGGVVAELMSQLDGAQPGPAAIGRLVELARTGPVLVAVDDADRLDEQSRVWLGSLAAQAVRVPLAVVAVTDTCLSVLPGSVTVAVRPLGNDGISALVTRDLGVWGDEEFVCALRRHTGGRLPALRLVLDRCAEQELRPGRANADAVALIATDVLADVTTAIVRSLPAEVAHLLRVIAVCGSSFPVDLFGALARLRTFSLARSLELLVCAGLVTDVARPELTTGTTVSRVLEEMPAEEREDLYTRAARLGHQCALAPAEVASLLTGAPPLGESWVVPLLRAVAREEMDAGRPLEAVRFLRRALTESGTPVVRAELMLELAVAECAVAPVAADRRLARMLMEVQPPECTVVRLAATDQLWGRGDAALLRRTLGAVRSAGGDLDAVTALYWIADDAPVETPELSILDSAELQSSADDPDRAGVAAWMCVAEGVDPARARLLARATVTAPARLLTSRLFACLALAACDDVSEAVAGLDLVVAESRRRRLTAVVPQALLMRAKVRAMAGDLDDAAADLAQARAEYPLENMHPDARPILVGGEMLVCVERGEIERAIELAASQQDEWIGFGYARTFFNFARAVLALVTGNPAEAVAKADECGRWMLSRQWVNPAVLPWRSIAAAALSATGDHERASLMCRKELELAQRWGVPSTVARAHLSCGAVLGDEEHLREAVRLLTGSPFQLLRANALLDLAHVVGPGRAGPMLKEAAGIAVLCRSTSVLHRARGLGWEPGA
ncbi:ATP-binding protein [Lentzea kentuckyensis]|uniref:ATP-binding protein n=1 Tax=Lentzea kentuckyensis TaxID=360086 RepID=UPI000A3C5C45|nr:ATP-binding protein [Lentzea kentuckyensis]